MCIPFEGRVVVFTDGACHRNQDAVRRFAGVGAFWAVGHPFNVSGPLEGGDQTNNRAELLAAIRVLQLEMRPLDIRSDSAYVVDGVSRRLEGWQRQGFVRRNGPIKNADLWRTLWDLLSRRESGTVKFTKVRGHSTAQDVCSGRVTLIDKDGNDRADALAVAGSYLRDGSGFQREKLAAQLLVAKSVQLMMVEILAERGRRHTAAAPAAHVDSNGGEATLSGSEAASASATEGGYGISSGSESGSGSSRRRRGRSAPAAAE